MNKQEISKLQIDLSKVNAIGQKYFDLFNKHIPVNISGNILIYDISNADCIVNIIRKNPNAKYFIYGNSFVNEAIKCINEWDITFLDETFDLYNIDMKFDCIVMNPPYKADLHLKVLSNAIKHLKDDNSVCVNLSPVRWLQDVIGHLSNKSQYNKYLTSVSIHTKFIDVVSAKYACDLFNGGASADLGIYVCDIKTHTIPDIKNHYADFILDKVVYKVISNENVSKYLTKDVTTDYFVTIPESHGHLNSKDWCDIISPNKKYGREKSKGTHAGYVLFDNDSSAENFRLYLMTDFIRFVNLYVKMNMSNRPNCIPWLGDAINPRTGLKGYEGEWTDEDLYKFFNITPDEQKIIEETMAKYK